MLAPDFQRLQDLSKRDRDSLSIDDFNSLDGQHMLKMCEKYVPMTRQEKHDEEGNVSFKDVPDLTEVGALDEISLLTFLKSKKAFK